MRGGGEECTAGGTHTRPQHMLSPWGRQAGRRGRSEISAEAEHTH